jgi:peptidyl-prolyl cis-trans isomerase C
VSDAVGTGRRSRLSRWLREPLVHFVLLGAVVFVMHQWVAPPRPTNRIVISDAILRGLRQEHLRRSGALPTPEEEAALIQRFVDNEILYREAIAEGLDRGDLIVRRRLVQKMEFVLEGGEPIAEPSDAELQAYLAAHAEHYAVAERVALVHVFVSTDQHGPDAERTAAALRLQLENGFDPSGLGDPFLRGREFPLHTERELAGIFGTPFAAQLMTLPAGPWSAPIRSSYGLHLVRITERSASRQPPLAEVRPAVQRDWQEERRTAADATALARLRRRYEVTVENSEAAASGLSAPAAARVSP